VRIVLSLLILVSVFAVSITNGCGNTSFSVEEEKVMASNVNLMPSDNVTQGYRTATFALG
jgi:hypothetical protein